MLAPQESREAPTPIDACDSAVAASTRAALRLLDRAAACAPRAATPFVATFAGTVLVEGHYVRPGDRTTVPVRLTLERGVDGATVVRETRGAAGRERTTVLRVADDGVRRRVGPDGPWEVLSGDEARREASAAARLFPAELFAAADRARPTCRPGAPIESFGRRLTPVTFLDPAGDACTLLFDADERLARAEVLKAHATYGDVCEWTRFDDYATIDGALVPRRVGRFLTTRDATYEHRLELAAFRAGASGDADASTPSPTSRPAAPFALVSLEPGIFAVESVAADARALVVERPRDLILLEALSGDDVTSSMLAFLAERFPAKKVAVVACGHHHPSPSGGLRAVAAAGAEVVVPSDLFAHYDRQLNRDVDFGRPAVAGPKHPRYRLFEGETRLEAGDRSVRLIDIGAASDHADRYVVFYFPECGLLFEGDLGWFPAEGVPRLTGRLRGLAAALAARGVRPRSVVQSWPVAGARRRVDWAVVEGLLRADSDRSDGGDGAAASRPASRPR